MSGLRTKIRNPDLTNTKQTFYPHNLDVQYRQEYVARKIYTVFIVHAYQTSTELLNKGCRAAVFFSASGAALSQKVADGKINVQSDCALETR
jgi:hypothetical protein